MKKLFIILIMLVYGVSSSGMTINLHYCCGKLDDVSFTGDHSKGCAMASVKKNSKCCHNQQLTVKLNTDQQQAVKWVQVHKAYVAELPAPVYLLTPTNLLAATGVLARGTPFTLPSVPIYLRNCVFRV